MMDKSVIFGERRILLALQRRERAQKWAEAAYEFEHLKAPARLNALLSSDDSVPKFISALIAGKSLIQKGKGKASAHPPLKRYSLLKAAYESDKEYGGDTELRSLDEIVSLVAYEFSMSFDTLKNKTKKKVPDYNAYIENAKKTILSE